MIRKMIYRELRSSPRFLFFFVFNLALGLAGLTAIELFKTSFEQELALKSKSILGSDLSVSSRKKISPEKIEIIKSILPKNVQSTKNISLFSMAAHSKQSKLVNVRIIGDQYPFYGQVKLEGDKILPKIKNNEAYIYPELKYQLSLEIGSEFTIGSSTFIVKDFIKDDGQQSMAFGSLAPRIYISKAGLKNAKLIQTGSTSWYSIHYKFHSKDYSKVKERVTLAIGDSSIHVNTAKSSSQQVGRILNYLNDFLGLVSLSGLFLACMGMIYLYRSFLHQRRREVAIFKFMGMKKKKVFLIYFGELLTLGVLGSVIGVFFGQLLLPLIREAVNQSFSTNVQFTLSPLTTALTLLIGIFSTIVIAPPLILPYIRVDHKLLFSHEETLKRTLKENLLFIPMILFYWTLAVYLSNSYFVGSLFVGIIGLFTLLIFPIGSYVLKKLSTYGDSLSLPKKMAFKYICRHRISTLFIFGCLSISTLLMTLIPQIKSNLEHEVIAPSLKKGPVFFLFDIQPEQVDPLSKFIAKNDLKLLNMSPMVRARLVKINGKTLGTNAKEGLTREEQREIRMRNRGVNLSYRSNLDESETLREGRLPKNSFDFEKEEFAEITVENRYAKRLKVWIGDVMEFDILGMPIKAKIVGIRDVKWTSFMPNFFISFGSGVLDDAPKTFLAALGNPNQVNLDIAQTSFANKFSNVSIVDVRRVIEKISGVISSMGVILLAMAALVLTVGLMVIYSLVSHQIYMRSKDLSLLKILGMKMQDIRKSLLQEMMMIALSSAIVGALISTVTSYILATKVFNTDHYFNLKEPSLIILGVFIFSTLLSYIGTSRVLKRKPSQVFSEV